MSIDRQTQRLLFRTAFFALFVLTPPLDLFRLDLTVGHFILLGYNWTLGLDTFVAGEVGAGMAAWNLFWRALLPVILVAGGVIYAAWRWGRLYCGWLCPHFSVVELINALMRRASGKPTLWEKAPLPEQLPDGRTLQPKHWWWPITYLAVFGFAFLWAVALLTYLLPPTEIYGNLLRGELTRNQGLFIGVGTLALSIEFLFARHLFCRYACAVGLFQSLAWMANRKAMVVGLDKSRVSECADCDAACDNACPMRLKPRAAKRHMFTCTQCARCLQACEDVQQGKAESLLTWVQGEAARDVSEREFGRGGKVGCQNGHAEHKACSSVTLR